MTNDEDRNSGFPDESIGDTAEPDSGQAAAGLAPHDYEINSVPAGIAAECIYNRASFERRRNVDRGMCAALGCDCVEVRKLGGVMVFGSSGIERYCFRAGREGRRSCDLDEPQRRTIERCEPKPLNYSFPRK